MLPWFADGQFPLYLAPMAGYTDTVFRDLCREFGADVVMSEFVTADGLLQERARDRLLSMVEFSESQRPMGIQIFGGKPEIMGEAAELILSQLRPDFLDINFGCPAPRVVGNCAGSSLLKDLPRLEAVIQAVIEVSGDCPVTVKIRIGWDEDSIVADEVGDIVQKNGVQALAIHGRTKVQGYRGEAHWEVIDRVARNLSIPVVGNGGIRNSDDLNWVREHTGVSGAMIGQAALGYPWIFRELKAGIRGEWVEVPSLSERWRVLLDYCQRLQAQPTTRWDDLKWLRPRLKAFTTRIPGSRKLRAQLDHVNSYEELEKLGKTYLDSYQNDG